MNVLRSMRGSVVAARLAYPDVLHVEIIDSSGGTWRLATQDAEWSPPDPSELGRDHGILLRSDHQNCPPWLGRVKGQQESPLVAR